MGTLTHYRSITLNNNQYEPACGILSLLDISSSYCVLFFCFQSLKTELEPSFTLKVDFLLDAMCFTSNFLLLRTKSFNSANYIFNCYDVTSGTLVVRWPVLCKHYLTGDSLIATKIQETELLVEGCPQGCQLIRLYNITTRKTAIAYENVQPSKMCEGPKGSVLVCDVKSQCLLLLTLNDMIFDEIHRISEIDVPNVYGMCYLKANSNDLAILSFANTKQVIGISLTTGDVIWTQEHLLTGAPLDPYLCSIPTGSVFLGNGNNLLVLNPVDGSHLETLLSDGNLKGISTLIASEQAEENIKVAIRHTEEENLITLLQC